MALDRNAHIPRVTGKYRGSGPVRRRGQVEKGRLTIEKMVSIHADVPHYRLLYRANRALARIAALVAAPEHNKPRTMYNFTFRYTEAQRVGPVI